MSNSADFLNVVFAKKWFDDRKKEYPYCVALSREASREYHPQWYSSIDKYAKFCTCGMRNIGRLWMFKTADARATFLMKIPHKYVEEIFHA